MDFSYGEVSKLVESLKDETENNRNYQFLFKGILQKLWEERINKNTYFALYIAADEIDNVKFDEMHNNLSALNGSINDSNLIQIDCCGNIVHKEYKGLLSEEMKAELSRISLHHFVFFFGEKGITRYINGRAIADCNIFYSIEDRKRYLEKKDISQINQVIHEYATQNVTQQVNYMYFFENNVTLMQIDPAYIKRNILKNKPEHFMRDHLREYLKDHMRYTFSSEPELTQSKRELDIYFDVKGELYFIEIKWLGVSINDNGTGLTQPYTDYRAREGVIQSLEYIEELINTSETSLRCGYLAIFDARDNKSEIDFRNFNFVKEKLKPYMQCFSLLEIIPLDKKHSA